MIALVSLYVLFGCIICWKSNLKKALPIVGGFLLLQLLLILNFYNNEITLIYFISLSLQFLILGFFSQSFPEAFSIIQKKKERMILGLVSVFGGAIFFGLLFHFFNLFQLEKISISISIETEFVKYGTSLIVSVIILMITLDQTIKGRGKWIK